MIAVCDMGPLQYLILIECDHILPQLFARVLTTPAATGQGKPMGWASLAEARFRG